MGATCAQVPHHAACRAAAWRGNPAAPRASSALHATPRCCRTACRTDRGSAPATSRLAPARSRDRDAAQIERSVLQPALHGDVMRLDAARGEHVGVAATASSAPPCRPCRLPPAKSSAQRARLRPSRRGRRPASTEAKMPIRLRHAAEFETRRSCALPRRRCRRSSGTGLAHPAPMSRSPSSEKRPMRAARHRLTAPPRGEGGRTARGDARVAAEAGSPAGGERPRHVDRGLARQGRVKGAHGPAVGRSRDPRRRSG